MVLAWYAVWIATATPNDPAAGQLALTVGALPTAKVDAVVRAGSAVVEKCYRDGGANQSGVVTLGWSISAEGNTREALVTKTTLKNTAVETCLLEAVAGWTFPAADPPGVTSVTYPFVFGDAVVELSDRPLPRTVVETLTAQRTEDVTGCSTAAGTMEIAWSVSPSGRVTSARVIQSTIDDEAAVRCALDAVAAWRFPPSRSERSVSVSMPFTFVSPETACAGGCGLPPEAIWAVIERGQGPMLACYERELAENPELAGTVEITWSVLPSGGVSDLRISQHTVSSATLHRCLLGEVATWSFPTFRGPPLEVSYPFIFEAIAP